MRIAVIGAGARAVLAGQAAHVPGARIVLVAEPSGAGRARARALFGDDIPIVPGHSEVVARAAEIDAAFVLTPDHTHVEIARDLLRAGIAVYLEKPMALDAHGADELLRVAMESGTRLYVGHNMRHMAVVRLMRAVIERGEIGEVKAVWCRHFVGNGGDYYFRDWHAERAKTNTLLLQKGAHDIDVIHYLAGGSSTSVSAVGTLAVYGEVTERRDNSDRTMPEWFSYANWPGAAVTDLNPVIDVEDLSMMTMRLDNGVLASYQQCHFTPDYWRNYTVIGSAGRLENFGDGDGGVVRVWNQRHAYQPHGDAEYPINGDLDGHEDADRLTVAEFLRFVEHGEPTQTSPVGARNAVAAAAAAADSLRGDGGARAIPPVDEKIAAYFARGQEESR